MNIEKWANKIYCGRSEDLISELPNNSIDLAITSPPYNVNMPYDNYQDNKEYWDYISWLKVIFAELKSKLVKGGRVCINIGDKENGRIPTHSHIIGFMTHELKYLLKTTIIWNKSQIGNRTSWGSWKSPANPSFPTPFEYILVFSNEVQEKVGEKEAITVSGEEFIVNSLALWTFAPENRMQELGHPAMFPIELPWRLIQQLSYKNDIVLDIFSGLGTTCLTAAMLKRRWIGFELSKCYVIGSEKRIRKYTNQVRLF